MKVWIQKTKENRLPQKDKWTFEGISNVWYQKGSVEISDEGFSKPKRFMELSFDVILPDEESSYFIASNIPYTYVDICSEIVKVEKSIKPESDPLPWSIPQSIAIEKPGLYYERQIVGRTISGLPILMITVSDQKQKKKNQMKKYVVISSWVHPNETNASFVFEGLLK